MNQSRLIAILLIVFLIGDLAFSFVQYYNTPIMGDLEVSVWPNEFVQKLFNDPFGFEVLKSGEKQFNPNRYFSHFFLKEYFRNVPLFLQRFVTPINSVYLTAAIAKIFIHLLLVFIIAFFVSNQKIRSIKFLIASALAIPLLQVYGYWSRMGILDRSIAYTFFYGGPMILLSLFFMPIFYSILNKSAFKKTWFIILVPLIIILPFTGPLNPPVIILVSFFIYLNYWIHSINKNVFKVLKNIPVSIHILLIPFTLLSLYSLYLGMYDASFSAEAIPLFERYIQLPSGIWSQLFHSAGFPLMLLIIGINMFIINKSNFPEKERLKKVIFWIGIFALIYAILLPIGGYRPYRPKIIRYDTFMPVTIALMYFFVASTYFLINQFTRNKKRNYLVAIVLCLTTFTVADMKGIGRNRCERAAFEKMANSKDKIVAIPNGCYVMDWANEFDYTKSEKKAELIHYWNITPEKKLFFNEP